MHRHGQRRHPRQRRLALLLGLGLLSLPLSEASAARAAAPLSGGSPTGAAAADPAAALPASTAAQKALSEHLRRRGAVFYGAFWCPACGQQKALFGKEASQRLPYVECADKAEGRQRCEAAEIRAYPTWDLPGKPRLEGVQSLEELQIWSEFRPANGPTGRPSATTPAPQR
jgi:hypothetical protein